ncbi:MAG: NAD(P)-dependent oxidoreductase, partial [Gammaproteobacteria bacterium]
MAKPRVVVTRRWPAAVEAALAERYEVELNDRDEPFDAAALAAAVQRADAVCPTVTDPIDAAVIGASPRARMLANFGVGFNHIDLDAARAAGIVVTNTPDVLTDCTADLTLTLMLMVARRAGEGERMLRAGGWDGWRPTQLLGARVSGKTLGLVGFGRIARAVAARAHHGFGMRVICHAPRPPAAAELAAAGASLAGSLEELLAAADFVSLHCPATPDTHHLLDANRIALLPDG